MMIATDEREYKTKQTILLDGLFATFRKGHCPFYHQFLFFSRITLENRWILQLCAVN
jgi:hypothetical protein